MFGHEHSIECCALAPPSSYQYPTTIAGSKKPPPASSTAEFMATGSRDKTTRLWSARGTCIMTLVGHDSWVRAMVFHPGGKNLLSASDDKTLRCWDLSQRGRCVKLLGDMHERFITCLRWAPGIVKDNIGVPGGEQHSEAGGTPTRNGTAEKSTARVQIRCIIATGGVDQKLRILAN
ncbi:hypothetical protein ACJ41O_010089 [Fusarium nematophilum]